MITKKKSRMLRVGMVVGALLLGLVLVSIVYAATVTIDTFNDGSWAEQVDSVTCEAFLGASAAKQEACQGSGCVALCYPASNTYDGSGILGSERDITITQVSGSALVAISIDDGDNNELSFSCAPGTTAEAAVIWDGDEGDDTSSTRANVISTTGLAGVDLTDAATNEGFLIETTYDDRRSDLTFEVYSDTRVATFTVALPGAVDDSPTNRLDIFLPFSDFNGDTSVFTSTGAIVMRLDGTIESAVDLTLDLFETTTAREYGDLPTSTYEARTLNAYHIPQGLRFGNNCDGEGTPNESSDATGDDGSAFDDEDGVISGTTSWVAGANGGTITATYEGCAVAGGCYINGWIDWDNDGYFTGTVGGASEHIINNVSRSMDRDSSNPEAFTFDTPTGLGAGNYYARFRICEGSTDCDDPGITDTNVSNGEIEDYQWGYVPTAVTLSSFTAEWDGDQVAVAWETALEVDTVGFNVWRSTAVDGDYVQVNDALIPAASPGGVMGGSYAFADAGVTPGTTYYYKLEEMEIGGARNWYGPASTGGGAPTAVTLSVADTALSWWPVAAGIAAGAGVAALGVLRRRRRN